MDLGNIHLYTGGFVPGYRTDAVMREERKVCGNRPMILSETGWHNANNSTATHYHTPEDVAGVYAPRLLLEYFIRRVPKIAIFELLDEWPDPGLTNHEAHFGMLRHDFSPKPAFVALANLAAIARRASGPGTAVGPGLEMTVLRGPADLRFALVAVPGAAYLLYVWRSLASIWDPIKRRRVDPGVVTAEFQWAKPWAIRRYVPAKSASVASSSTSRRTAVALGADLQVLEFRPA
ncbi:glycoside hydrolase family protein [Nostocoides jenkinsii]|uniref:Uncharacterized protein n=1 Tax=Nostocoides jenkinsii Ben 74 TaxID=1193518 RepID=A0A077MGL9_9MICO|nr:hypothetical protein [Tetrasphaera jenkinsii]CCI54928.1 hypothetical protein BN13_90012 [Tetrasphaera jenkinsii Ben 74]